MEAKLKNEMRVANVQSIRPSTMPADDRRSRQLPVSGLSALYEPWPLCSGNSSVSGQQRPKSADLGGNLTFGEVTRLSHSTREAGGIKAREAASRNPSRTQDLYIRAAVH